MKLRAHFIHDDIGKLSRRRQLVPNKNPVKHTSRPTIKVRCAWAAESTGARNRRSTFHPASSSLSIGTLFVEFYVFTASCPSRQTHRPGPFHSFQSSQSTFIQIKPSAATPRPCDALQTTDVHSSGGQSELDARQLVICSATTSPVEKFPF